MICKEINWTELFNLLIDEFYRRDVLMNQNSIFRKYYFENNILEN